MDIRNTPFRRTSLSLGASLCLLSLAACAHQQQPAAIGPQAAASPSNHGVATAAVQGSVQTVGSNTACNSLMNQQRVSAAQILYNCGQPTFRDTWGAAASAGGPELAPVEEWYYNYGPGTPVQVLRFLQGNLIHVSQDGAGFDAASAMQSCNHQDVRQGLSKYRLTIACGQPLTRQAYVVDPSYRLPNAPVLSQGNAGIVGQTFGKPVYREDLAYRFANGAVQNVTLENGRVLGVGDRVASAN